MACETAELRSFFSLETVIYYLSIAHMASSGRRTSRYKPRLRNKNRLLFYTLVDLNQAGIGGSGQLLY